MPFSKHTEYRFENILEDVDYLGKNESGNPIFVFYGIVDVLTGKYLTVMCDGENVIDSSNKIIEDEDFKQHILKVYDFAKIKYREKLK